MVEKSESRRGIRKFIGGAATKVIETVSGNEELQPIFLTTEELNPNGAQIRFFVDGASAEDIASYDRAVYMFDGNDQEAVAAARERWKIVKGQGHDVTYWQQSPEGRWEKKA